MDHLTDWNTALLAYVLAQFADVITTLRGLRRGGVEANPLIRLGMERLGTYGWVVVKVAGAALAAVLILSHGAVWMLWLLALMLAVIGWRNTRIGRH